MLSGHVVVCTPLCVRPAHAGRTPRHAATRRSTLGHAAARPNVHVQQWARRMCDVRVGRTQNVHAGVHSWVDGVPHTLQTFLCPHPFAVDRSNWVPSELIHLCHIGGRSGHGTRDEQGTLAEDESQIIKHRLLTLSE